MKIVTACQVNEWNFLCPSCEENYSIYDEPEQASKNQEVECDCGQIFQYKGEDYADPF